jgi:hypothetical protein
MSETFTDKLPEGMPDAAALIEQLRAEPDPDARQSILAGYPVLELLAPIPVLAKWLDIDKSSVYMARTRKRPDGSPVWPDEDETILGRKMWRFSTIALSRATAPGRGWNLRGEIREGAK